MKTHQDYLDKAKALLDLRYRDVMPEQFKTPEAFLFLLMQAQVRFVSSELMFDQLFRRQDFRSEYPELSALFDAEADDTLIQEESERLFFRMVDWAIDEKEHHGDCIKQCITCMVCVFEGYLSGVCEAYGFRAITVPPLPRRTVNAPD